MRKARFTEHQIIAVIKSVEAGRTVKVILPSNSGHAAK
ncbi:IS1400 transposase [Escherichia coli]|nr:IS1400 transposase [Escherichia coli]